MTTWGIVTKFPSHSAVQERDQGVFPEFSSLPHPFQLNLKDASPCHMFSLLLPASGITSHPKDRPLDGLPHFQALSSLAHPPCCPFSLSTSVAVSSLACIFQCNTARADPRAWPLPALGPATTLLRPPHLPCSQKMPFHLSTPLLLLLPPDQHSFLTSYSFSKV